MSKKGIYYSIPDKYKYSVAFDNIRVKPLVSEEKDKYLSIASANLKRFLPKDLSEENIGLLAWAGNFCVANKINLNSDCISTADALYVADLLPYTYVDLEHDKSTVFGVILNAGFSEYGTDKPLTKDEVKDYTKPFNITVGGVIWRVINEDFADAVESMGQPDSKETISLSWEMAFNDSNLILIDRDKTNLEDGKIISDASEISKLENSLQSLGGSGFVDDKRVARLIINKPLPLGAGFVEHPAGQVGTIITETTKIQASESTLESAKILQKLADFDLSLEKSVEAISAALKAFSDESTRKELVIKAENLKKSQNSNSQLQIDDVKPNTDTNILNKTNNKTMLKIKELTEENLKQATASEIIKAHKLDLDEEINRISKEWEGKRDEVQNKLSEAEKKIKETEAKNKENSDKLAEVQEELNKLVKAAQDKEAEETFNARMTYFDTEFELDDKSRNAVANRIKGLDEAGYKQEKEDLEVLLAAKKKGKKPPFVKDDEKEKKEKETKASEETTATTVDDAIDKGTKVVPPVAATTTTTETQAQKFAKAFGKDNWEINPKLVRK